MDIKFGNDSNDSRHDAGDGKGKQNALLVVLLLLVGAFGYVYFFTGLIKPAEEKKAGEGAPAATQVAKKPLPPADGAAKPEAVPAAKPETAPAPADAKPAAPEAPKAKVEQKPADDVQAAVKKPLPGAAQPAPAKPAAAPAPAKPAAPPAAKPAVAKPAAPAEKKVAAVTEAKPQPAKEAEKKPADAKSAPAKPATAAPVKPKKEVQKPAKKEAVAAPAKGAGTGEWTVLVDNYVLEEALATDLAKVRRAGFQATVTAGGAKKTHMNRLLLAEFTDREAAQTELAKLKKYTSDAFMIDKGGMHAVYAGSYLLDARAASEKERLGAVGFKLTLTRVDVSIPSKNLVAGTFADKAAAEETLKKLKAAGLKASLSRQ